MFPSGHIFLQVHGTLYYMPKAACTVRSHVATGKHVRVPKSHRKGKTRRHIFYLPTKVSSYLLDQVFVASAEEICTRQ